VTHSSSGSGWGDLGGGPVASPARGPLRLVGEQALSRAAGAPLVPGNRVRLLRDATENYPAWLAAIERASRTVLLEAYIFADDPTGNRFADALVAGARRGVRVRVLHDWLGDRGEAGRRFWRRLERAGVEVRSFNPFRFDAPLAWLRRDHGDASARDPPSPPPVRCGSGARWARRWEGGACSGLQTAARSRGPAWSSCARRWSRRCSPAPPSSR
jgi:cardiolipin synthase